MIKFNKPYLSGKELYYISQAVHAGETSGNKSFTKKCHKFFKDKWGFNHSLMTTSCTDALEMAAILLNIAPGDEVIAPSYTFVSTVNAFILRGAKIKFVDSKIDSPNLDESKLEELITSKTKVIIVVHYAGIACDMDKILDLAKKYELFVVEDAAQSIDSYYKGKPLGKLGDIGTFSFHETKNIISGEGGMLTVNNLEFIARSEIIWEKGTNRSAFFRGQVDKYNWVDIGSSFLPSELIAAFLYAQLENLENIQRRRSSIWKLYYEGLKDLETANMIKLPKIPSYATNNGHMFYIVCNDLTTRTELIAHLGKNGIKAVFHYLSLHASPYFKDKHDGRDLLNSDIFSTQLLRLPFYYELTESDIEKVISSIKSFYKL